MSVRYKTNGRWHYLGKRGWQAEKSATFPPKPGDAAHWLVTLTLVGPLFKRVLRWTGKQCQCEKRRQRWNELGWGGIAKQLLTSLRAKNQDHNNVQ